MQVGIRRKWRRRNSIGAASASAVAAMLASLLAAARAHETTPFVSSTVAPHMKFWGRVADRAAPSTARWAVHAHGDSALALATNRSSALRNLTFLALGLCIGRGGAARAFVANGGSLNGAPGMANFKLGRERDLPRVVTGYKKLKAAGVIESEWLKKDLPPMVASMTIWASMQRRDSVPDKVSRKLEKDTKAFEKAVKSGLYEDAMKAFDTYLQDLPSIGPAGTGKINFDDPTLPPEEVMTRP